MPFLQIDDLRLHYRVHGNVGGPVIVLLHGLGSSGADWAFQAETLGKHFHLVIPDLRGSGHSDSPRGPYSIAQFAADIWALLDALHIERAALMGFSLGGTVAFEMILLRPHAITRVMTINTLPSYRVNTWRKRVALVSHIALVRGLGMRRTAALAAKRLFQEPHQAPMRRRVVDVIGNNPRRPYLETMRALAGWCAIERLASQKSEMLMLAGEHDYTPLAEKRAFAERLGATFVVVGGSRHGTPFDSAAACNAVALAFFLGHELPHRESLVIDPPEHAPLSASEEFLNPAL